MPDFILPSTALLKVLCLLSFGQIDMIDWDKVLNIKKLEIKLGRQDNYINNAK